MPRADSRPARHGVVIEESFPHQSHEYPGEVEFVTALPMTTTGKFMRGELRAREAERRGED